MPNVLVLGASGRTSRLATDMLADNDADLTLFVRAPDRLTDAPASARVVAGDVLDRDRLADAVRGQDIVYADLAGALDTQAERIAEAMTDQGVPRLIFITSPTSSPPPACGRARTWE
ncbi:NAD(P)H-binding protein [Actinomadura syzygii]|uniref:NAD(P)H-binding protein n=1 Tax=Actinomadura syzygii TaxID=1427538 RepID=UPI001FE91EFA|nr:NAD(P)H-binding protein [Actinomadura syzygii]